jgi:hypothetical protein
MHKFSKKYLFAIILILCAIASAAAQSTESEQKKHFRIGAGFGYSFAGYREDTYTPVNRYLNTLTFIIDGNIEKDKFFHTLNMHFFMGDAAMSGGEKPILQQSFDPETGESTYTAQFPQYLFIRGGLEYALDYRLWGNDEFPGYLGAAFRADAYVQIANYPNVTGSFSLALHASQKWIINAENKLTLSLSLPFFGYAVRPAYAGADQQLIQYAAENPLKVITLGKITSLHNYWAVFGDIKYQHTINSLLSLYSGLYFELSRFNVPKPRIDAIFRLNTGIAFIF